MVAWPASSGLQRQNHPAKRQRVNFGPGGCRADGVQRAIDGIYISNNVTISPEGAGRPSSGQSSATKLSDVSPR